MNIFICDDDNLVCEQIKTLCESYYIEHKLKRPDIYIFHSGEDILASDIKPDIVYLDIQMSGIDGIAVGNSLVKSYPAAIIIIITSFPEYLDEAMRFHVFRYISKPVESKRFMRNLEDAISEFNSIGGRIIVKCKGKTYVLSAKDIIMVEVNPHCRNLTIHTVSDTYTTTQTLASIKSMLPSGSFYQSHRCYIVNMNYIMSYNNSRIYMENHLYADIALRKYNDFFNTYSAFLTTLRQFINQRGIYEFNIVLFICISYRSHYSMAILQPDIYFTKEHIFISFNHYWHVQSAYTCSNSH